MALSTLPMSAALASRPPIISDCEVGTAPRRAVLALDLGTTTGWALRSGDGAITSGTMTFRPSRFEGGGMRFLRFRAWLTFRRGARNAPSPTRASLSVRSSATRPARAMPTRRP